MSKAAGTSPPRALAEAVRSLDGDDDRLLRFLPYLLQDLWDIGSNPKVICELIGRHAPKPSALRVLDLGCGKGAVAVTLAKTCGCRVEGIDALGAFIEEAQRQANRMGVADLCKFTVGDLRRFLASKRDFDVVIWGAVGPVLGSIEETLGRIQPCVRSHGLLVMDDAYAEDGKPTVPPYLARSDLHAAFGRTGWAIVEERSGGGADSEENAAMTARIRRRAAELASRNPSLAQVFDAYVRAQEKECESLETRLICSTWLLRREERRGAGRQKAGALDKRPRLS